MVLLLDSTAPKRVSFVSCRQPDDKPSDMIVLPSIEVLFTIRPSNFIEASKKKDSWKKVAQKMKQIVINSEGKECFYDKRNRLHDKITGRFVKK